MYTYLTPGEVRLHSTDIGAEFNDLMSFLERTGLPDAKQWLFFRHCFDALLGNNVRAFKADPRTAAEFRRAITERLETYYESYYRRGFASRLKPRLRFQFRLATSKRCNRLFGPRAEYPSSNGYMLLVLAADPALNTELQTRASVIRAADDAIHAAYDALRELPDGETCDHKVPEQILRMLARYCDVEGTAYAAVVETLNKRLQNCEVLSAPSTRPRLLEMKVNHISAAEASVSTNEFWNLHWLHTRHGIYSSWYQGADRQTYSLVKRDEQWLVHGRTNYRPPRG